MDKAKADQLVEDLLSATFSVTQTINPAGPDDWGLVGDHSNVSVGMLTFRHERIKKLIEIAEAHECELYISSFHKAGDIHIITKEEAKHLFPAHHVPPPMPGDAGIQLRDARDT